MKQKISLMLAILLLSCSFIFAQNGGIPVELKPLNPPSRPPWTGITPPIDTLPNTKPSSLAIAMVELNFECYQNSNHLTLSCNIDELVSVVIYEMLSGVKYTSSIDMVAGEIYTIDTPWGAGLYTIRLTLSDGTILEGDFQIK